MLKSLKENQPVTMVRKLMEEILRPVPEKALPYLRRMKLDKPADLHERFMRKTVLLALRNSGRI